MKMVNFRARRLVYKLTIMVMLLSLPAVETAAEKNHIEIKNGKISAAVQDCTLQEVLQEVQRQTSLRVRYFDAAAKSKRVGATFDQLDLEEGLKRLLRENYVFYFVEDPQKGFLLSEIIVGTKSFQADGQLRENVLSYGSGRKDIGVINGEEGAQAGPASFCAGSDGTLYIADTVNNKIKIYSAEGKFLSAISLKGEGPNDIIVDEEGNIFVYDLNGSLYQYDSMGNENAQISMDKSRWETLGPMHKVDDKIFARANGVGDILLATVEKGKIRLPANDPRTSSESIEPGVIGGTTKNRYTAILNEDARGAEVKINTSSATSIAYIPLQDIVSVEVLGEDRYANFYVKTEADKNNRIEVEVSKFDSSGTYTGTIPIPGDDYRFWSIRTLTVNSEGIIDQLMPGKERVIHRSFEFN